MISSGLCAPSLAPHLPSNVFLPLEMSGNSHSPPLHMFAILIQFAFLLRQQRLRWGIISGTAIPPRKHHEICDCRDRALPAGHEIW